MITFTSIEQVGTETWKFTWTGTGPYDLVLDGVVIESDYDPVTITIERDGYTNRAPGLEVYDTGAGESYADSESYLYPPYTRIQWRGDTTASYYEITNSVTSAVLGRVAESGKGYYQFSFPTILIGASTYPAYVTAYDAEGVECCSVLAWGTRWGVPTPPDVDLTYSAVSGEITISAA